MLVQRCPTHSPLATCGEWPIKCGEWHNFQIVLSMGVLRQNAENSRNHKLNLHMLVKNVKGSKEKWPRI